MFNRPQLDELLMVCDVQDDFFVVIDERGQKYLICFPEETDDLIEAVPVPPIDREAGQTRLTRMNKPT